MFVYITPQYAVSFFGVFQSTGFLNDYVHTTSHINHNNVDETSNQLFQGVLSRAAACGGNFYTIDPNRQVALTGTLPLQ